MFSHASGADDGSGAAGAADLQAKFAALPLESALASKVFGIRALAYEALKTQFDEAEPQAAIFSAHGKALKAMVGESNPSALDKGLDCVLAFCEKSEQVLDTALDLMKDLINKGFTSKKPEKVSAILLAFFDAVDKPDEILTPFVAST